MRHYSKSEFNCSCCGIQCMEYMFLCKLDVARDIAGVAFVISSGFRCPKHDLKIRDGKSGGSHPKGISADIEVLNSRDRFLILTALMAVGFTRFGMGKDFIHVDADTTKQPEVIWLYDGVKNDRK